MADQTQVAAVVAIVMDVIGDGVVAIYEYGSAVMGGLRPHSDIDLFVVVDCAIDHAESQRLVDELMAVSGVEGKRISGRPVEVTVVRQQDVVPWTDEPVRQFQYGDWMRAEFEAGLVPTPVVDPDLAPLIATVLTSSDALAGPPAREVLDAPPDESLRRAMRLGVPSLLDDLTDDTANVLLTLARIAYTIRFGEIVAKDAAAEWAIEELRVEHVAPLVWARDLYLGLVDGGEAPDSAADTAYQLTRLISSESGKVA